MGSGSRALVCKSASLIVALAPSLSTTSSTTPQLRFKSSTSRLYRMAATEASSSSSSVTAGDGTTINPPSSSAANANERPPPSSASSAIDFLSLCHRLKTTKRAGWVKRDVKDPESIADHMYRMGLMALIASDIPGLDRDKCIKIAIIHDIAEAIVGDITPSDGISKEEKSRREREALDHMCKLLGGGSRAQEIGELWLEYEENSSPEAKIVKDLDKVEMILQALEYENEQGKDLDEFFQSTAEIIEACIFAYSLESDATTKKENEFVYHLSRKFQTELGKAWASEIASRRRKEG